MKKIDCHGYEMRYLRRQCGKTRHADYMSPGWGWEVLYNTYTREVILSLDTRGDAGKQATEFWASHNDVQAFFVYTGYVSGATKQQQVADMIAARLKAIEAESGLSALDFCRSRLPAGSAGLVEAAQAATAS